MRNMNVPLWVLTGKKRTPKNLKLIPIKILALYGTWALAEYQVKGNTLKKCIFYNDLIEVVKSDAINVD